MVHIMASCTAKSKSGISNSEEKEIELRKLDQIAEDVAKFL